MHRQFNFTLNSTFGLTFLSAGLAPVIAYAGPMVPIQQHRQVNAMTIVPPCEGSDFDSAKAVNFLPFNSTVDAFNICDFAQGIACTAHTSEIGSTALNAWSSAVASAISDPHSVIHAIPNADFRVTFSVATAIEYRINGSLTAQGGLPVIVAQASVKLSDPANNTYFVQVVNPGPGGAENTQAVSTAGMLNPGTYTVTSIANVIIDSYVTSAASGNALASINFHAAIPGDTNGDNLVNVDDLLNVINAWGMCDGKSLCPADISPLGGDGAVNVDDLLKIINHWN